MSRKIELPNLDDIIKRYKAGESLMKLSNELGIARGGWSSAKKAWSGFCRQLVSAGVHLRTRSEAQRTKQLKLTDLQRRQYAFKAQEARRGQKDSIEVMMKRAITWQKRLTNTGRWESEVAHAFKERGFYVSEQYPLRGYNIDVALVDWRVAVEIETSSGFYSRRPKLLRRTKDILDSGWSVVFVYASKSLDVVAATDKIVANLYKASPCHSGSCAYGVIRSDGKFSTLACHNLNGLARVF